MLRFPEGAWAYYRLAEPALHGGLASSLLAALDFSDSPLERDRARCEAVKRAHAEAAANYFAANAGSWDRLRSLHVSEAAVEAAMREAVGDRPFGSLLDIGTGTGRILELFQDLYGSAVGIDPSQPMLAVARANLERAGIASAQVRQGDVYSLTMAADRFDLVTIHQVLHFLDDPGRAVGEAARMLRPGGRLLIVDFAPHDLEFLRADTPTAGSASPRPGPRLVRGRRPRDPAHRRPRRSGRRTASFDCYALAREGSPHPRGRTTRLETV